MKLSHFMKKQSIKILFIFATMVALALFIGIFASRQGEVTAVDLRLDDQEATVRAIKKVMPSVVSVTVTDNQNNTVIDLQTGQTTKEKQKKEAGSGTGFIISADGLIITNKHVVSTAPADTAEYRVTLNSGKKYYAQLIGKDPLNDLAILKIFDKNLPYVEFGDSDKLTPGITVIAIGNALGIYQNSVTKGIVSGLNRNIVASDQSGNSEALGNVIQTDAEINFGNSGGPLVDLSGKVVGINVAIDASGKSIGFAIPVNDALPVIRSVKEIGRIVRPRLGVQYMMITPDLKEEKKLTRSTGAWINAGDNGGPAVIADSPAAKAGLQEGDIVFEINGVKLNDTNNLFTFVQRFKPGQKIGLKIDRVGKIMVKIVLLDEFK